MGAEKERQAASPRRCWAHYTGPNALRDHPGSPPRTSPAPQPLMRPPSGSGHNCGRVDTAVPETALPLRTDCNFLPPLAYLSMATSTGDLASDTDLLHAGLSGAGISSSKILLCGFCKSACLSIRDEWSPNAWSADYPQHKNVRNLLRSSESCPLCRAFVAAYWNPPKEEVLEARIEHVASLIRLRFDPGNQPILVGLSEIQDLWDDTASSLRLCALRRPGFRHGFTPLSLKIVWDRSSRISLHQIYIGLLQVPGKFHLILNHPPRDAVVSFS